MIFPLPTRAQQPFDYQTANRINHTGSLYPTFVVYLTTIGGRLELSLCRSFVQFLNLKYY